MKFKVTTIALAILISTPAKAYDLSLTEFYNGSWLNVDESYIEYRKYEHYRNPYLPDVDNWNFRGEFHNKFSLYSRLYWDTNLHMSMAGDQMRYAGLEYYIGFKIFSWFDLINYHHSEHSLDKVSPNNDKFPVEDSIGFRIYFKQ